MRFDFYASFASTKSMTLMTCPDPYQTVGEGVKTSVTNERYGLHC